MKKEWFFDRFCGEQIVAYAEDGILKDAAVENEAAGDDLGNIYKGKVKNVVDGMQAAFVDCGMERNCYLPLYERAAIISSYDGGGEAVSPTTPLKEGDEILVQVVKPARGSKGAKVTRDLSFVGKSLIYLPNSRFLGISRKLLDEELRATLLKEVGKLIDGDEGYIVRTAAQDATRRRLKTEAEYLKRIYRMTLETAASSPVGACVYREFDLPLKIMRDSLGGEVNRIYVGDRELYERVLRLAKIRPDLDEKKVELYTGERQLFRKFGLSEQIYNLTVPRADLENGGYLVIERTEAMTVIDVNTGSFTGKDDLETTVFETNLLAAREIARLVRLRNIGGIVAVDFIDMQDEKHRTAVEEELQKALSEDKTKTRVYPMDDVCVTLFTRKRTHNDLLAFLLKSCPHCRGGYVLSDTFMEMRIRSGIMDCFAEGFGAAIVELNRGLLQKILHDRVFTQEIKGRWKDKRIYCVPHSTWDEEKFTVRGDNSTILTLPDDAQILY
ncbi:MAG: Rne/Rng family ribonuclease [Clostridia bacterium]|nr:Rne/Rng family ribonuclease [Clostridia bacterium]